VWRLFVSRRVTLTTHGSLTANVPLKWNGGDYASTPSGQTCFLWSEKIPTLGHNLALISVLYSGERPEITSHDEELRKAKTTKIRQKETITMKTKLTKMIMSSLAVACALVCLAATMVPGTPATARAEADGRVCSVGMLRGLYLWTFDGHENFGGNFVPKAIMQGLRFNGDGTTFNPFGTVNIGGTIIIDATGGVGTYTVAADCTGTLSITDGPTFNIYVGPGAQQVWTLETSPSPAGIGVSVGTAVRVP